MFCAISGEQCQEPVITKNGIVYEKRIITRHLEINSSCPVSGEPLTVTDLIPIKINPLSTTKPRQLPTASLPGLMQNFQNEWDNLMLETYNLKKQLETLRNELSHALYQNDASCRVIARLMAERDSARRELENVRKQLGITTDAHHHDALLLQGLDNDIKNKLTTKSQQLSTERKVRETSTNLATTEALKEYKATGSYPLHKASSPGVLCVDIHPTQQDLILTGGVDRTAILFDKAKPKKLATLTGHSKEVHCTLFHPTQDLLITGSADTTVKLWLPHDAPPPSDDSPINPYRCAHTITKHAGTVIQMSLHPTNDYIVTASYDHTWAFHDLSTAQTLIQVVEPDASPLTCAMLHPDGLILATGTNDNLIRIWDLKSQKNVATFQGHKGLITDLRFSENGYYLVTAAEDQQVKLWDLRGPKNIHSIKLDVAVTRLCYDWSGKYLAAATGKEIRIFTGKNLDHVITLDAHTDSVTDVKFGNDAHFLASTSLDRSLKLWNK